MNEVIWKFRTFICPLEYSGTIRNLCRSVVDSSADSMFTVLVSDNEESPNHTISSGLIDKLFTDILPYEDIDGNHYLGNLEVLNNILRDNNVDIGIENLKLIVDTLIITDYNPIITLEKYNLHLFKA